MGKNDKKEKEEKNGARGAVSIPMDGPEPDERREDVLFLEYDFARERHDDGKETTETAKGSSIVEEIFFSEMAVETVLGFTPPVPVATSESGQLCLLHQCASRQTQSVLPPTHISLACVYGNSLIHSLLPASMPQEKRSKANCQRSRSSASLAFARQPSRQPSSLAPT